MGANVVLVATMAIGWAGGMALASAPDLGTQDSQGSEAAWVEFSALCTTAREGPDGLVRVERISRDVYGSTRHEQQSTEGKVLQVTIRNRRLHLMYIRLLSGEWLSAPMTTSRKGPPRREDYVRPGVVVSDVRYEGLEALRLIRGAMEQTIVPSLSNFPVEQTGDGLRVRCQHIVKAPQPETGFQLPAEVKPRWFKTVDEMNAYAARVNRGTVALTGLRGNVRKER